MSVLDIGSPPLAPVQFEQLYESNAPRFLVVIDGQTYTPSSVPHLEQGAHGVTDSATVTLPISNNPDFTVQLERTVDNQEPVSILIYGGFPQNPAISTVSIDQLVLLFTGQIDLYTVRFLSDSVTFSCRNAAAPLIDTKITTYKPNWTTKDFIEQVVPTFGLGYAVNLANAPATLQEVLGYDNVGGASLSATIYGMKIMDMLIRSAQYDDADVWADQQGVLHYESPSVIKRNTIDLHAYRDFTLEDGLEGTHSPQFSKNVQVTLHTANRRTRTATSTRITTGEDGSVQSEQSTRVVSTANIPGTNQSVTTSVAQDGTVTVTNSAVSGGNFNAKTGFGSALDTGKEKYVFFVRNVTPQRANILANTYWRQISLHEYSFVMHLPMTKKLLQSLSITSKLRISGCEYARFNGVFFPRRITQSYSPSEGWHLTIEAANHIPSLNGV